MPLDGLLNMLSVLIIVEFMHVLSAVWTCVVLRSALNICALFFSGLKLHMFDYTFQLYLASYLSIYIHQPKNMKASMFFVLAKN